MKYYTFYKLYDRSWYWNLWNHEYTISEIISYLNRSVPYKSSISSSINWINRINTKCYNQLVITLTSTKTELAEVGDVQTGRHNSHVWWCIKPRHRRKIPSAVSSLHVRDLVHTQPDAGQISDDQTPRRRCHNTHFMTAFCGLQTIMVKIQGFLI